LKAVSTETGASAVSVYKTSMLVVVVMIIVSALIVVAILIFIVNARKVFSNAILEPVNEISEAAGSMAKGRMKISIAYDAKDELGQLAKDLDHSTTVIENVVSDISASLDRVASGDFSKSTDHPELYVEDFAPIKESVDRIVSQLSGTIRDVKTASSKVAQDASNLAHGAQELAEGATDQAAAVEELTASVESVNNQTKDMAASAEKGCRPCQAGTTRSRSQCRKNAGSYKRHGAYYRCFSPDRAGYQCYRRYCQADTASCT